MSDPDNGFKLRVIEIVKSIPAGRVMTYGQIAAICGNARSARIVGGIAHYGDQSLPWHRVVNKSGVLALGYPGGRAAHAAMLRAEGLEVDENYKINISDAIWNPQNN